MNNFFEGKQNHTQTLALYINSYSIDNGCDLRAKSRKP